MRNEVAFIYDERFASHELSATHPMKPVRLKYTYELLQSYGCFDSSNSKVTEPRAATLNELMTYHTEGYIEAVKRDFEAGGTRRSDYDDYEMDDYVEDFDNYFIEKMDS